MKIGVVILFIYLGKRIFDIEFAPITIFYGDNGSGKSTLLNIIIETINKDKKVIRRRKPLVKSNYFDMYTAKCNYNFFKEHKSKFYI